MIEPAWRRYLDWLITKGGQVSTVAGGGTPGYADGNRSAALFDTPCGVAVMSDGSIIVADTGNDRLRKITRDGKIRSKDIRVVRGVMTLPQGVKTDLVSATIIAADDIEGYDPTQD